MYLYIVRICVKYNERSHLALTDSCRSIGRTTCCCWCRFRGQFGRQLIRCDDSLYRFWILIFLLQHPLCRLNWWISYSNFQHELVSLRSRVWSGQCRHRLFCITPLYTQSTDRANLPSLLNGALLLFSPNSLWPSSLNQIIHASIWISIQLHHGMAHSVCVAVAKRRSEN